MLLVCTGLCAQNGRFAITMKSGPALKDHPVMMSAIGNGAVVSQREIFLKEGDTWATVDNIPPGSYDVRIEGEGLVTEVKRGVQMFPGKQSDLSVPLRAGTGVHIVEYAIGGLAREEVAARLKKLDGEVADLQKKAAK
ncbi:MAG TPA: hypothetical protein VGV35_06825 [Bryobacteraceae bacterium]|nr:hypothetical protein [Bryobacteraceae bacterium]